MPINFLSPGLAYLSRGTLALIILPLVALWILQSVLAKSGFDLPPWFFLTGPAVLQFIVRPAHSWFTGFTIRREAAKMDAVLIPSVQGSSISILGRVVDGFKNGYPGLFEALLPFIVLSANCWAIRRSFSDVERAVRACLFVRFIIR